MEKYNYDNWGVILHAGRRRKFASKFPPYCGNVVLFREKALRNFGYNISFIV